MTDLTELDLTTEELHHLHTDAACVTLEDFEKTVLGQNELRTHAIEAREKNPNLYKHNLGEPCHECKHIAKKLGLEVVEVNV